MTHDDAFTSENLNLFLDDELDPAQRAEIMEAMRKDEKLGYHVCELMQMKESVRIAYDDPPPTGESNNTWQRSCKSRFMRNAVAAVLLLAVGTLCGLMLGPQLKHNQIAGSYAAYLASSAVNQVDRIVLHVSESNPDQFSDIMVYLTELMNGAESDDVRIEVIANAGGVDFMRANQSPMRDRIIALMDEHHNISFIACANSIRRLKTRGIDPVIIQGINTDKSAIDHLAERLQSGWSYIKADTLPEISAKRNRRTF